MCLPFERVTEEVVDQREAWSSTTDFPTTALHVPVDSNMLKGAPRRRVQNAAPIKHVHDISHQAINAPAERVIKQGAH